MSLPTRLDDIVQRAIQFSHINDIFTSDIRYLRRWSRHLEEKIINAGRGGTVYVAFQDAEHLNDEAGHYDLITQQATVYLFAAHDTHVPPGMQHVPLSMDNPLRRQWFIVADCPMLCQALIAAEEPRWNPALAREFHGVVINEPDAVHDLVYYLQQFTQI